MPKLFQPYTYLLVWSKYNLRYYGCRYAKNCYPDELWVSYFTSSKYVADTVEKYGDPDIIYIDQIFSDIRSTLEYEKKILSEHDVINSNLWLNKNIGGIFNKSPMTGRKHTNQSKLKMSRSSTGKKHSEKTKQKMSQAKTGQNHPNFGKTLNDKQKLVISKSKTGKNNHQFSGYFITPWGKFTSRKSASEAAPEKINPETLGKWCKNNHTIIPNRTRKTLLLPYKGQTYFEAGFSFEHV